MRKNFLWLCLSIFMLACGEEAVDCSLVLCRGNETIRLELIRDGSNVLADGTYTENEILITGDLGETGTIRILSGLQGGTEALLEIEDPEWDPGMDYSFQMHLGSEPAIGFDAEFGISEGECCGGFRIFENVTSSDVQVRENPGYVTLILD